MLKDLWAQRAEPAQQVLPAQQALLQRVVVETKDPRVELVLVETKDQQDPRVELAQRGLLPPDLEVTKDLPDLPALKDLRVI